MLLMMLWTCEGFSMTCVKIFVLIETFEEEIDSICNNHLCGSSNVICME